MSGTFQGIVDENLLRYDGNHEKAVAAAVGQVKKAGWIKNGGEWIAPEETFKRTVEIAKRDDEKRQVFGWALVAFDPDHKVVPADMTNEDGQVVDHQKDLVDEEDLEAMAYRFTLLYREGGEMHMKGGSCRLIESVVFTREKQAAMGLPEGALPIGWWIGFQVDDDKAWQGIKDGVYKAFSIEGSAIREAM